MVKVTMSIVKPLKLLRLLWYYVQKIKSAIAIYTNHHITTQSPRFQLKSIDAYVK